MVRANLQSPMNDVQKEGVQRWTHFSVQSVHEGFTNLRCDFLIERESFSLSHRSEAIEYIHAQGNHETHGYQDPAQQKTPLQCDVLLLRARAYHELQLRIQHDSSVLLAPSSWF
jgi:hypothetical protein